MRNNMLRFRWVVCAGTMLASANGVSAQSCLGLPNVAVTPRTISTTGAGTDLGRTLVARYGMAGERVFGGAVLGAAGQKFAALRTPVYGADIGAVIPLGASGATQLCPVLQSSYQHGPNGSAFTSSRLSTSLGLSLGRTIDLPSSAAVVPFVQGGIQHLRQSFGYTSLGVDGNGTPLPGDWGARHNVFGEVAVGFGLRLNRRLTVTPSYRIPLGVTTSAQFLGSGRTRAEGVFQQTYSVSVTLGLPR